MTLLLLVLKLIVNEPIVAFGPRVTCRSFLGSSGYYNQLSNDDVREPISQSSATPHPWAVSNGWSWSA